MSNEWDAFISYSRQATRAEAEALQAKIQTFAKPWNRLRGARVFRDDASMSANAGLWPTIERALIEARYFILILSPAAAASEWVNNEVQWWLDHKSPDTILLVHADGHVAWRPDVGFDTATDCVPPALRTGLSMEPRWVDLTWFSRPGSTGASDPRFQEIVADLAAPIRGVERDELIGEHVSQLRRARRLSSAAIVVLSLLLALALVAGLVALQQRDRAVEQTELALEQARIATARLLAAESLNVQTTDIGRAQLLAIQAWQMLDDPQTRSAMIGAHTASTHLDGQLRLESSVLATSAAADGSTAYLALTDGSIVRWSPDDGQHETIGTIGSATQQPKLITSRDGSTVVIGALSGNVAAWQDGQSVALPMEQGLAAVSPSGRTLAIAHSANGSLALTFGTLVDRRFTPTATHALADSPYDIALPNDHEIVILGHGLARRFQLEPLRLVGAVYPDVEVRSDRDTQYPYLSAFGDKIYDQHSIIDTVSDLSASPRQGPTLGERVAHQRGRYGTSALSADGRNFADALNQGRLDIYRSRGGDSLSDTPTVSLEGSLRYDAISIPSDDWAFSADGPRVTRWNLRKTAALASSDVALEFSILPCDICMPPIPKVNADGSAFGVSQYLWFEMSVVQRSGEVTTLPERSFLAWHDTDTYFVASASSIELRRIGSAAVEREWPLPADVDAAYRTAGYGHWSATAERLRFYTTKQLCELTPASGTIDCSEHDSVGGLSPDGKLISHQSESTKTPSASVADEILVREGSYFTDDGGIAVIDLTDGRHHMLPQGSAPALDIPSVGLSQIPVSPDGTYFLNRDTMGEITIYSRATGSAITTLPAQESFLNDSSAGFSGDSSTAVVLLEDTNGAWSSIARFVDLDPATWRDHMCAAIKRPLTADEWNVATSSAPLPDQPLACA